MKHAKKQTNRAGKTRKAETTAPAEKATRDRPRDPWIPAAGTVLKRTYKGREIRVTVLDAGFRHDGKEFRSLTAIALAITGYPAISGPAWFGLAGRRATTPKPTAARGRKAKQAAVAPKEDASAASAPAMEIASN